MAYKVLSYSYDEVLRFVLADASERTGVPIGDLNGSVGEHGAYVEHKKLIDLVDLSESVMEILFISSQCRTKYAGEWLRPAQLTENEVNEILDRLSLQARREMYKLLVGHGNRLAIQIYTGSRAFHTALQKPVADKYYRLASGTNRAGCYMSQLWEVRPPTA